MSYTINLESIQEITKSLNIFELEGNLGIILWSSFIWEVKQSRLRQVLSIFQEHIYLEGVSFFIITS